MKKLFIVLLLFAVGCKTNPPLEVEIPPVETGAIIISSNVDGAMIFVDNVNSGKITPDTLKLAVGNRTIRLEKQDYISASVVVNVIKDSLLSVNIELEASQANKIVLLEDFANVSCDPCVTSNQIIFDLFENQFGPSKLVVIKYPTNFPAPNDLFYLSNKPACDARISYYSVFAAPTTRIDGINKPNSTDANAIRQSIEQRLLQMPKFKITVSGALTGSSYRVNVSVQTIDTTGLNFANLVLHTVVTETNIEFSNPPGSNGETKFYDVMRVMLPSINGEPLTNVSVPGIYEYTFDSEVAPKWNGTLHAVAFIQDKQTKEVYQTGSNF